MAMVINSNIQSLNAQRHLNSSLNAQNTATERLSSGLRINSAADDAAGLAIANRMTSQVKGLDMAIRNANDGVSMIQTAEGALSETTNILQRMRELSIQSANGIYDEGNRGTLNAEVQQLKAEIDRIAETTTFNGLNILDGSLGEVGLQVGEKANQTIDLDIQATDTKTLGLGSTSVDVLGAETTLATFTGTASLKHNEVLINGQSVIALGDEFNQATAGTSEQDLVDAINENVNGVTASTVTTSTATTAGDGVLAAGTNFGITVTSLDGTSNLIEITDTENLEEFADKLNTAGGGLISASITEDGYLSISSENTSSIAITTAAATATGTLAASSASIALSSDNGDPITIERGGSGSLEDLALLGFRESNNAGTIEGSQAGAGAFAAGDLNINGVDIGKSDSDSLTDKIEAINALSQETGVTAVAFATASLDFTGTGVLDGGVFALNGTDITIAAGDAIDEVATAINAETGTTGVTATKLGSRLILEGDVPSIKITDPADGSDVVDGFTDGNGEVVDFASGFEEATAVAANDITDDEAVAGGIKLISDNGNPISVTHADAAARTSSGLLDSNSTADGKFGAAVNSLDISTAAGANKAIEILDVAIQTVSDIRGDLGAVTNRLNSTVSNLANVSENASAAKSRIMDADFAAESANLSRAQVLQQAGNAMLAQANSRPQQVLSLLQ